MPSVIVSAGLYGIMHGEMILLTLKIIPMREKKFSDAAIVLKPVVTIHFHKMMLKAVGDGGSDVLTTSHPGEINRRCKLKKCGREAL